ncbi:MAG: ATP-binding protein [Methylobacter sp.]|nr:ATP-binding protein [Methylobacter sp.]
MLQTAASKLTNAGGIEVITQLLPGKPNQVLCEYQDQHAIDLTVMGGLGFKAVEAGYKVCFSAALTLIEALELAELKGELKKKINQLLKFDLLIIDELGYLPMNKQGMDNLFQLINAMYEYRSIILTTNKEFTHWGEFFFDGNVAVPIVDRIIHHSHIFMLGGESYRLKSKLNK